MKRSLVIEKALQVLSACVRGVPINRLKGRFIRLSLRANKYKFDYTFRCRRLGVNWSAAGFPDLLTRHMMFEGVYQEDVIVALRHFVKPGAIVYDVGGHHGLMAIVAARAAGSAGKVVTFEPNPNAREQLRKNLALNQVANVLVEELALSDRKGEIPFYVQTGNVTWNSTIIEQFADGFSGQAIRVPTRTLDDYRKDSSLIPEVIKIDTEGSEFVVLKGAAETIEQHRPIILMEFNPLSAQAAGNQLSDYVAYFRDRRYRLTTLKRNRLGHYRYESQEPFDENIHTRGNALVNVLCIPEERV